MQFLCFAYFCMVRSDDSAIAHHLQIMTEQKHTILFYY